MDSSPHDAGLEWRTKWEKKNQWVFQHDLYSFKTEHIKIHETMILLSTLQNRPHSVMVIHCGTRYKCQPLCDHCNWTIRRGAIPTLPLFHSVELFCTCSQPAITSCLSVSIREGKYSISVPVMIVSAAGVGAHYLPDDARSRVPGMGRDGTKTSKGIFQVTYIRKHAWRIFFILEACLKKRVTPRT